jgi:hypothetical protein
MMFENLTLQRVLDFNVSAFLSLDDEARNLAVEAVVIMNRGGGDFKL